MSLLRILSVAAALAIASPALAQPADAARADEGRPIVIGRSYAIASRVLGGERRLNVYLPAHYGDPKRRFPVLYLLDGGEKEDFHHITGLVDVAAAYGAVQELIVVGIEGVDRRHDLTAPSSVAKERADYPTTGASTAYRRFLVDEVKPWVAARYRTSGRSGLIGESLAGLFTVETLLKEPAAFDDYIAASPSLWWSDQALSREAAADLQAGAAKGAFQGKRLWIAVGNEGTTMQAGIDRVVAAVKAVGPAGPELNYDPRPNERHDSIYDPVAIAAIRTLYAAPKAKPE